MKYKHFFRILGLSLGALLLSFTVSVSAEISQENQAPIPTESPATLPPNADLLPRTGSYHEKTIDAFLARLNEKNVNPNDDTYCDTLDSLFLLQDAETRSTFAWFPESYASDLNQTEFSSGSLRAIYEAAREKFVEASDALDSVPIQHASVIETIESNRAKAILRSAAVELVKEFGQPIPNNERILQLSQLVTGASQCVERGVIQEHADSVATTAIIDSFAAIPEVWKQYSSYTTPSEVTHSTFSLNRGEENKFTDQTRILASIDTPGDVTTDTDLALYAKSLMHKDSNIRSFDRTDTGVSVSYLRPGKLFGFIPTSVAYRIYINTNHRVAVKRAWYGAFVHETGGRLQNTDINLANVAVADTSESQGSAAEQIANDISSVLNKLESTDVSGDTVDVSGVQ